MRILNVNTNSETDEGCDRLFDGGDDDVLVQLRPATATDHAAITPNYVPEGELMGRLSKAALLDAARSLGFT